MTGSSPSSSLVTFPQQSQNQKVKSSRVESGRNLPASGTLSRSVDAPQGAKQPNYTPNDVVAREGSVDFFVKGSRMEVEAVVSHIKPVLNSKEVKLAEKQKTLGTVKRKNFGSSEPKAPFQFQTEKLCANEKIKSPAEQQASFMFFFCVFFFF